MKENKTASSGISFCGLLQITLLVLKLCKVIGWDWCWVLAPTWIPLALLVAVFIVVLIAHKG